MQTHKDYSVIQNEAAVKYVQDANLHIPSEASGYMPNISTISIVIFHKDKVDTFSFSLALSCHGCQKTVPLSRPMFPYGGTGCCEAECPECGNRISVWLNGANVAKKKVLSLITCPLTYTNHQQLYPICVEINEINLEEPGSPTAGESVQSTETANVAVYTWNPEEAILGRTTKMQLVLMANGKYQMIADIYRSGIKTSSHATDGTWSLNARKLTLLSGGSTQQYEVDGNSLIDSVNNRVWNLLAGNLPTLQSSKSKSKHKFDWGDIASFAVAMAVLFGAFYLTACLFNLLFSDHKQVQMSTMNSSGNQQMLANEAIYSTSSETRKDAIDKITDQRALIAVATKSKHFDARKAAVDKLTDQEILSILAVGDNDMVIRATAVPKINDQQILGKVAIEDNYWVARLAAVDKLTSQQVLAKIAGEDEDSTVRAHAIEKLVDQKMLTKVVTESKYSDVRRNAVRKLVDQITLGKIAIEDVDSEIRCDAVLRLTNREILTKVAIEDKEFSVRAAAKERLQLLK